MKRMKYFLTALTALTSLSLLAACANTGAPAVESPADKALRDQAKALFGTVQPVSAAEAASPQAVLGRALFWDTRLSLDGKTACASCHAAADWSADRRALSINAKGQPTSLHSQPMFMAQDQASLRWYGDRKDGAHQAERSITGSMGLASAQDMVPLLKAHGYEAAFEAAFAAVLVAPAATPAATPAAPAAGPAVPQNAATTPANYATALAVYQRSLRTPAPFDAFLQGDAKALSSLQKQGMEKFIAVGCVGCHSGPLLGGNSLQKFGLVKDYWPATRSSKVDLGRYTVTQLDADKYVFRVAMLRNIEKTAPYFHDGSVPTLDQAVRVMADVQLGRSLPDEDVRAIVAFLAAMTGPVPTHYAAPDRKL
jgi:cytochrome c peroxidase